MQRIHVIGTSGSGKSTLSRELCSHLNLPHIELDALHWLPNWQGREVEEFRTLVREAVAADAWVVDGNYRSAVQKIVWERADTIVWLDLPRATVMRQVIARSLRRWWRQEVLWSGNRETLKSSFLEKDSVVRWAWNTHALRRAEYGRLIAEAPQQVVRLKTRREARDWLATVGTEPVASERA